ESSASANSAMAAAVSDDRYVLNRVKDRADAHTRHDFFLLRGTFAPALRACDRPIAIACLRLLTFLPERPLLSVPRLRSFIAILTFRPAFLPYFAMTASPSTHDYHLRSDGCERQNREWPRRAQRRRIARDVQGE